MIVARDLSILIARVGIGIVFIAYGYARFDRGLDETAVDFAALGIPAPEVAAYVTFGIEVVAGAALLVGLLTPLAGVLLVALTAATAFYLPDPQWQLLVAVGVSALMIAGVGAGRFSLDAVFGGPTGARRR